MVATDLKLGQLKKRSEFLFVAKGAYAPRHTIVIQGRRNPDRQTGINIGFTATKKVGGAVIRNRAKRRLRVLARQLLPDHARPGYDYVFIARHATPHAPWQTLLRDGQKALIRLEGLLKSDDLNFENSNTSKT